MDRQEIAHEVAKKVVETSSSSWWEVFDHMWPVAVVIVSSLIAGVRYVLGTKWKLERDQAVQKANLEMEVAARERDRADAERHRAEQVEDSSKQWEHIDKLHESLGGARESLARIEGAVGTKKD